MRIARNTLIWVACLVVLLLVGAAVWINIRFSGEREAALHAWNNEALSIEVIDTGILMLPAKTPAEPTGLVFIPGAKVDPYGYMDKLSGIVEAGHPVLISFPTLGLAIVDATPLDSLIAPAPSGISWAVGGHSLGGVRACQIADTGQAVGLVLFGSYCVNDLSAATLPVLSLAAENDGLSTATKIADAAHNLPADTEFLVLEGANHAGFGDYGAQPGDGSSTLSDPQLRALIGENVSRFLSTLPAP